MTAREAILGQIREALGAEALNPEVSYAQVPRDYNVTTALSREHVLELFLDRLIDYDTEVIQVKAEAEIAGAIVQGLHNAGETLALASAEFPAAWLPQGFQVELDGNLSVPQIEAAQAVITTCEAGVASTGTIILVHEGAQARRVLTLLPDHHICVVRRDQVLGTVPESVAALGTSKPITTISGPSATSDIEMTRIRGVHGPRHLTVVLYGDL